MQHLRRGFSGEHGGAGLLTGFQFLILLYILEISWRKVGRVSLQVFLLSRFSTLKLENNIVCVEAN